jgi:hypothetical protein
MGGEIKTKDNTLEVHLLDEGMVEIESRLFENVGIEVSRVDPTKNFGGPTGAMYRIQVYKPESDHKVKLSEYDIAWVMPDGTIVKRGEQY